MAKFATAGESYIKVDTTCYALNSGPVAGPPDSGTVGRTDFVDCVECASDCSPVKDTWHLQFTNNDQATSITNDSNSYVFTFAGNATVNLNNLEIDSCGNGGGGYSGSEAMERSANPSYAIYYLSFGLSVTNGVVYFNMGYSGSSIVYSQRLTNETVLNFTVPTDDLTTGNKTPTTLSFTVGIRRASASESPWT